MPENWQEEQALNQRNQGTKWRFGVESNNTCPGRVLRSASRPPNSSTAYLDIVLLSGDFSELDLNETNSYGSSQVLPVRPYVSDVACDINSAPTVGSIVTVLVRSGRTRIDAPVELGNDIEDYAEVLPGRHQVVSGSGGGSTCAIGIDTFGVTGLD